MENWIIIKYPPYLNVALLKFRDWKDFHHALWKALKNEEKPMTFVFVNWDAYKF